MAISLTYAIKYVADMDAAVAFHRDKLGLGLRFHSPGWSEFETGQTTLALHPATPQNPPGSCQLGFGVPDLDAFFGDASGNGVEFTSPPTPLHGRKVARIRDTDGSEYSVAGP
jgi:catechol 2,3-dioxygenase-like lactoylglutathione lyase family enzyme